MKLNVFLGKASNMFAENRLLKFAIVIMSIGMLGMGFVVYSAVRYKETVLIPSDLSEEVSITRGIPDDNYTKKVIRDVISLALNYSPATVRWQYNDLLQYFAPESYPDASKFWYDLAGKIEATHVSSIFYVRNILIEPNHRIIRVVGDRSQYVDDQIITATRKTYEVSYEYRRGRFTVLSILEKEG